MLRTVLFSFIPCAACSPVVKYCPYNDNTKLKTFLNLFKLVYLQKLCFIYTKSINNIYRMYVNEQNDNSYSAIRFRRSLCVQMGSETICKMLVRVFFLRASQRNIILMASNDFVWQGTNWTIQDQFLQDKYYKN